MKISCLLKTIKRERLRGEINAGMMYIILIMIMLAAFAFILTGGEFPSMPISSILPSK